MSGDCDGMWRAGGDTSATAGAFRSDDTRQGSAAQLWGKTEGIRCAAFAADAAFDAVLRQAACTDACTPVPGNGVWRVAQRFVRTGLGTFAAECAFPLREIDCRVTPVAEHDDLCRAKLAAIVAAAAGSEKIVFRQGPGGAHGLFGRRKPPPQKTAAQGRMLWGLAHAARSSILCGEASF